jgi:hypothetical protein
MDELIDRISNNFSVKENIAILIAEQDIIVLADYYDNLNKKSFDLEVIIGGCTYKDVSKDIYEYLVYDQRGYNKLYEVVAEKYNIIPDKITIQTIMDYYYDYLLS